MKKRLISVILCAALLLSLLPAFAFAEEKTVETVKITFYGVPYAGGRIKNYGVRAEGHASANGFNIQHQAASGKWVYLEPAEYDECFLSGVYYRYEFWLYAAEGYRFSGENLASMLTGPSGTVAVADKLEEIAGETTVHCYLYLGRMKELNVVSEIRGRLTGSFTAADKIRSVHLAPVAGAVWTQSGTSTLYRGSDGWHYVDDYDAYFDPDTEYRLELWADAADGYVLDRDYPPEIFLPEGCGLVGSGINYEINSLKLIVNLGKPSAVNLIETVRLYEEGSFFPGERLTGFSILSVNPEECLVKKLGYFTRENGGEWEDAIDKYFMQNLEYMTELWIAPADGFRFSADPLPEVLSPYGTRADVLGLVEEGGVTFLKVNVYLGKPSGVRYLQKVYLRTEGNFAAGAEVKGFMILTENIMECLWSGSNALAWKDGWVYVNGGTFEEGVAYKIETWIKPADGLKLDPMNPPEVIAPPGTMAVTLGIEESYGETFLKLDVILGVPLKGTALNWITLTYDGAFAPGAAIDDFRVGIEGDECRIDVCDVEYEEGGVWKPAYGTFKADREYRLVLRVSPEEGYDFPIGQNPAVYANPYIARESLLQATNPDREVKVVVILGVPADGTPIETVTLRAEGFYAPGERLTDYAILCENIEECRVEKLYFYTSENGGPWEDAIDKYFMKDLNYMVEVWIVAQDGYRFGVMLPEVDPPLGTGADVLGLVEEGGVTYLKVNIRLGPFCPTLGYDDVPPESNWAHQGIDFCVMRGIMGSTSTEKLTFEPTKTCTRAEIASILYRLSGSPAVTYSARFTDVPAGKWYTDAIIWCAENGVVSGSKNADGTYSFKPMDKVTREQMAVMLKGFYTWVNGSAPGEADLSSFADANKVTWSRAAVAWAVSAHILSGKAQNGKTYLDPQGSATRQEVASILMRFCVNFVI